MKKICVVVGSRANYSSIKSAMKAIDNNNKLELQLILSASSILDKYGDVSQLIKDDGFKISERVFMLIEGESLLTMAKSTGVGLIELSSTFDRIKPNIVITIGDRFETMSTTLAAAYMNIPIAHTMGGEITGTIDERIRHATTKFADIHFPASKDAKERIIKLGEKEKNVHLVGCPRIDLVKNILNQKDNDLSGISKIGVGEKININKPFILLSQHPVTTEYGKGEEQINETLEAIKMVDMQTIVLWPNADAGSDDISKGIRKWREKGLDKNIRLFKNLPTEDYIKLMKKTSCLVGNSSSGIREGTFIGTPVVNIGTRQRDRERGKNVIDVEHSKDKIYEAIKKQLNHGPYKSEKIYGSGDSGLKISEILENCTIDSEKRITY